ncbi:hypothetical protein FZC84_16305 [Rossellomorea vietnamensis]|uniref:Uncharacterized protein n=1 Tax=Rossellomorea vietnamensis TaxID=218284 RepID=A0A5D4M9J2_9BACI|nr:hypothetical protein [Rossellomorea vietnamensis]TYR98178.1 hypothetical protein FZC84_16305 [Rossellomorea vietnamensis]
MRDGIKLLAELVNGLHDVLIKLSNDVLGLNLTDKDLHFWIMGFIGIGVFFFIFAVTKWLSKMRFGITMISFLYTMTFMFVLVFAIEIQQAITNRGNMEFADAVIGLWGFLVLFMAYGALGLLVIAGRNLYKKYSSTQNTDVKM